MNHLIQQGKILYWGTSEWPAEQVKKAHEIAEKYNCFAPSAEQPQYNLFSRDRVEKEYAALCENYGLGLTTWSPLASGLLTGKYLGGIPKGSRLDKNEWLRQELTPSKLARVKKLAEIAASLDCSLSQLSIAWCLSNPKVSSVITGATTREQLEENLSSSDVKDRITDSTRREIERVLASSVSG